MTPENVWPISLAFCSFCGAVVTIVLKWPVQSKPVNGSGTAKAIENERRLSTIEANLQANSKRLDVNERAVEAIDSLLRDWLQKR